MSFSFNKNVPLFSASQISSIIGLNPFETRSSSICKYWRRIKPGLYNEAVSRNEMRPPPTMDEIKAVIAQETVAQRLIDTAIADESYVQRKEAVSTVTEAVADKVAEKFGDTIDTRELQKSIQSIINTDRGTRDEVQVINSYESREKKVVKGRNDKFYKKYITYTNAEGNSSKFAIGGRVDGITEDNVLLEVKNRQRRVLGYVPINELIQISTYLYLTNLDKCQLVECHGGETVKHSIEYDAAFMDQVIARLTEMTMILDYLNSDLDAQDALVRDDILICPPWLIREGGFTAHELSDEDDTKSE